MSKLRAEIKWSHRKESNSELLAPSFQESIQNQQEVTNEKNNETSNETEPETESRLEPETESRLEPELEIIENEDNIINENFNDEEVEISANETEELADIDEEEDEIFSLPVGDIIHPAVDSNTKWDLITLFNELPLP
ncbi:hypothetical protein F8M41_014793 [Gigaspora margarita]|uniref:Uncharacterized protein n=1 Tax=Gigaspora margarita TaxID=4874 RepID=A0A8H4ARE9_GIGMA|nr:hypothetical protein F8M41_014793 [Gigaspora margarita]